MKSIKSNSRFTWIIPFLVKYIWASSQLKFPGQESPVAFTYLRCSSQSDVHRNYNDRLCKIASRTTVNVIKAALQQIVSSSMVKLKKGFNTALSTCRFVIYSANKESLSKTTGLPEDTFLFILWHTQLQQTVFDVKLMAKPAQVNAGYS